MTGFEVCKIFLGMQKHFTGKHDYINKGPIRLSPESYSKQKTVLINRYEYIGSKFTDEQKLEEHILATIIMSTGKAWIGDILAPEAKQTHIEWEGRMQSLYYNFSSEVKRLMLRLDSFSGLFTVKQNEHPELLKSLLRREISLENFVLLDIITDFITTFDKKLGHDMIWKSISLKARRYRPFLESRGLDKKALRKALKQAFDDLDLKT